MQRLPEAPAAGTLLQGHPRARVLDALRRVLDGVRAGLLADPGSAAPSAEALLDQAGDLLRADAQTSGRSGLRRVVNATGIVLHTNLGRAPLPRAALDAVCQVGAGYSNLEFDLGSGRRGARMQGIEPLLAELTGAEAGLAVNNAAAAVLLALGALAGGGEVVVSRGELVEIGGGFRIPT